MSIRPVSVVAAQMKRFICVVDNENNSELVPVSVVAAQMKSGCWFQNKMNQVEANPEVNILKLKCSME